MPLDIKRTLPFSTRMIYDIVLLVGLLIAGYLVLMAQNLIIAIFVALIVYSLFYPTLSFKIGSKKAYILHFYSVIIGVYLSVLFWCNNFGINFDWITAIAASLVSVMTIIVIHFSTRELVVAKSVGFNILIQNSGSIISPIALGMNIVFSLPASMSKLTINNSILVMLVVGLYAFSSSSALNSAYRRDKLNRKLETERYAKSIEILKEKISRKFSGKPDESSFLIYLLNRMTSSFISGDYERCFIDAVTIIKDETVVDPKTYREKILESEKWEEFRITRAALVHSRIREKTASGEWVWRTLSEEEVLEQKKKLFKSCMEIQRTVFDVVSLISQ